MSKNVDSYYNTALTVGMLLPRRWQTAEA